METRSVGEINWDVEVNRESDMFGKRPEEAELRGNMDGAVIFVNVFEIIEFFAEENGGVGAAVSDTETDIEAIGLIVKDEVAHGDAEQDICKGIFRCEIDGLDTQVEGHLEIGGKIDGSIEADVEGQCGDAALGTSVVSFTERSVTFFGAFASQGIAFDISEAGSDQS